MSFTGIGRIGSQHILNLNVTQDTENFLFPQAIGAFNWWCTHPIKYSVPITSGGTSLAILEGNKIVTGLGTQFTNLCADIQMDNKPIYRYVVGFGNNTNNPVVLDIDYVIDDTTMVLKFPAPFDDASVINAYPIDYFNTMILKQVTINNMNDDYTAAIILELESKFGETVINLIGSRNFNVENEGGVEPLLIAAVAEAPPILNY
jgi:hypothetical protein